MYLEEHNTSQDMGKTFNMGMLHQGSSRSNRERAEMNIRVKKGLRPWKTRCCSSWGENKKLLNFHEQRFAELEALKTNSQIFQTTTNATLKNLETQIGKLALTLQNQIKDAFPSDTKKIRKTAWLCSLEVEKN